MAEPLGLSLGASYAARAGCGYLKFSRNDRVVPEI
jgi:hypothetical protein